MEKLVELLRQQEDYFGSGGRTTPQFNKFYTQFKRELSKELKSVGATDIKMSKGHFELGGFFTTASQQIVYFSLGDVRWGIGQGEPKLMFRTATSYKDFSGGSNKYQVIKKGMASEMVSYF
jgi:hypothetical protein